MQNPSSPIEQAPAQQEALRKHPGGRPTAYKPEFCTLVVELGKEGAGKAEMASACGVVRQTLDNWIKAHPEFLDAITRARAESLAWWEKQGRLGIFMGKAFNANAYALQVFNRFPDDWKRNPEIDAGDGSVTVQIVKYAGTPKPAGTGT